MLKPENKMEDLLVKVTDEEHPLWQELTTAIGPNFHNYPQCVEFHLKVLKYLKDYREKYS